jgi:hypothetical protein
MSPTELTGWVRTFAAKWSAKATAHPIAVADRQRIIEQMDAVLPVDYVDLVSQTEGLEVNTWRIHGFADIRRIPQPEHNYFILAESAEGDAIAVRQRSNESEVYFLQTGEEPAVALGKSFVRALEKQLSRAPGGGATRFSR